MNDMAQLGFTFYPKDWWTSDSFYTLNPFERYIYLELLFMMYDNSGYILNEKIKVERRLSTTIREDVWLKITDLMVKEGDQITCDSVNKRLKKATANRENGKKGGAPKGNNNAKKNESEDEKQPKQPKITTQNNPPYKEKENNNIITTNSINNLYNYSFVKIDDFPALYKKFEFEKKYLFLAYKFWEMWNKENPNQKTLTDAKISKWYEAIRLIVEVDKQKPDKLIGIYCYFQKCASKESGFDDFWFKTVKSVSAFRKKDKDEVYYLDKIISHVNNKIAKDQDFSRLVQDTIKKFNK